MKFLELQHLKFSSMKKIGLALFFAVLANFISAEVAKTVNNLKAGTLSTVLTATEKTTVTKLTLAGTINALDFSCMRDEMTALADVDLSGTTISAYNGNYGFNLAGEIPVAAFSRKSTLKSFVFPSYATSIGYAAFQYCSGLTSLKLDSVVNTIGDMAFQECTGLVSVTFSDMLKTIRNYAFYNCSSLTKVEFGTSLDSIGSEVFNNCVALKTIRFMGSNNVTLSPNCFDNIASGSIIFIPAGSGSMIVNNGCWNTSKTTLYEYRARVTSQSVVKMSLTAAKLTASIDFITEDPILSYGFCWSKTNYFPTITDSRVDNGTTKTVGNYSNIVTTLTPGEEYNIRAFATDKYGTFYGSTITYNVPAMPSAASSITGLTDVYQGQRSVTYTVPTINFATSYIWTLPSGATGASTTKSITVSFSKTAASGKITVFGRNENGDGTASSLNITVHSLPKDAGMITGYSVVCQGESQVTYSVPAIDYATSYVWTLPSGATGTSTTNAIVVDYSKTALSGSVSVVGKNYWGSGTASTLAVAVHQLPVLALRDSTLTVGSTLTFSPNVSYTESGTLKYKWMPSTGLSNDSILNPIATASSNITYSLTVTTAYGCTVSKDVKISLKAMDKPAIGIVGIVNSKNRIAWNKPVSQGVASYLIYKETIVSDVYEKIGTVPYDSISVFVDASSLPNVKSSKYKISIMDKSGVESPSSDPHKTMHLAINKGQNNSWNLIWEAYEGFKPSTYNIYRGTSPTSLNFLDATSGSSTQYSDLDAPTGNVYYQLEVISPNLVNPTKAPSQLRSVAATYNSSRSNVAAGIVNGLDETKSILSLYPNPVKDVLNIEMVGGSSFEILNLTGQVVFRGDLNGSTVVNTSSYKPGMYVVKVKVADGFEFRKIIKE